MTVDYFRLEFRSRGNGKIKTRECDKPVAKDLFRRCEALTAQNMTEIYEESQGGYSSDDKMRELKEKGRIFGIFDRSYEKLIGFIKIIKLDSKTAFITELQVDKDYQRQGFGRHLLETATYAARWDFRSRRLEVCVESNNIPGQKFFEAMGYTVELRMYGIKGIWLYAKKIPVITPMEALLEPRFVWE